MVGVTKIQRGNAGYWLAAVAEGGDDYYTKPGEAPGEWVGSLADELGLAGEVEPDAYNAILDGRDPNTDAQLLTRPPTKYRRGRDGTEKRIDPVLGFDIRFSCPKSVSLLYALGDESVRSRVVAIVNEAVRQGLAHMEAEACAVQREKDGGRIEPGRGFVGMAFRHRMSRAGDPALHVHVVISNLTRAAKDGKWMSLASPQGRSPLWTHGKSAGVVFQAALRALVLREFGLEFEEVVNGHADLKDIPREAIDATSTRAKEITEWVEERGLDSAAARQVAAYRTRANKDYGVDEDDRRAEWIEQTAPHGVTPESVGQLVAEAVPREPRPIESADLAAALSKLEETRSHFDRRQVLWGVADQLPEGADVTALEGAVKRLVANEQLVTLYEGGGTLGSSHYTTAPLAAMEERFIECALASTTAGAGLAPRSAVDAVLKANSFLDTDQREMVVRLTTGGEKVIAVAAWPGTGKTTALATAKAAWDAAGVPVVGCATARTASGELIDAGITDSTSIARLLMLAEKRRADGRPPLAEGTVIILDEASISSTPDLEALRLLAVECGGKLVMIGDARQIGAIGPGGLFGHLTRITEPVTLTTIHRQKKPEDRQLVALVHEGRGSEALDLLRRRGRVIVGDDLPSTLNGLLTDWHRDFTSGADAVMIARRNRDVAELNAGARELRRAEGSLGEAEVIVGELPFASGDRVQTRINSRSVNNRERWDVLAVDPAARTVTLRRVGGDERVTTLGPGYLDLTRHDGGPALDYAYALTKFGAQGKTVDRAYPLLDPAASLEEELVAISRGREVANVYAVASSEFLDPELGPVRRELLDSLHDVRDAIEREGNEYPAAELKLRKELVGFSRIQLAQRRAFLAELARKADPILAATDQLDSAIRRCESWAERMRGEREAIEAMPRPPADELARASEIETGYRDRLRRHRAEREALPAPAETAPVRPLSPAHRLEAILLDERIEQIARRDVRDAQLDPTTDIASALGPYPLDDPSAAVIWDDAAQVAAIYRGRHGVREGGDLLGPQPRGASDRAERARAQRHVAQAQRRLGQTASRELDRSQSLEL